MTEQEANKDWIISRWLDNVEAKTRSIRPEVWNDIAKSYSAGYRAALQDFKQYLRQIGIYAK